MLYKTPIYPKNKKCGIINTIGDMMKRIFNKIDKPLLLLTILFLVFGLMMEGSASSLKAYMSKGNSYYYFFKQLAFIIAGCVCAIIIICKRIKSWKFLLILADIAVFFGLVYVLINGDVDNGITGWIHLGPISIQPSEFAKTAVILSLAIILEEMMRKRVSGNIARLVPFLLPVMYALLIYKQPDFGTMIIILGITIVIFLITPYESRYKLMVSLIAIAVVSVGALILTVSGHGLSKSQMERFNFKNPCDRYREKTGYQVCNGYIAINSGGLLGTGYGKSKQKYLYLPEAHTDFIYAIVIEEMGLLVGIAILISYFLLILRIVKIGRRSYNLQGMVICYGTATYIGLHVIVNLIGLMGLFALTGVPLPFFSYGGSFMLNLLICLGFVQRVSVENKIFEQQHLVR